jgi:lipopolysaccharide export system protein LptA
LKISFYVSILIAIVFFVTIFSFKDRAVPEEEKKKLIKVIISADSLWGEENAKIIHLENNIKIEQAGMSLTAQKGIYYTEDKIIEISGNVTFTRPGTKIRGDKVVVYPRREFGAWQGHVEFLQEKNSPAAGNNNKLNKAFKDGPVRLLCDTLEFYWGNIAMAVAKGKVQANQKDKYFFSDMVTYTEKPQKLVLEGNIKLGNEKGMKMNCDRLTLYIEEERVHAEGIASKGGLVEIQIPLKKKTKQ